MAYNKSPIWEFSDVNQTGIDKVPLNRLIHIQSTGKMFKKLSNDGLTSTSTVTDLLRNPSNFKNAAEVDLKANNSDLQMAIGNIHNPLLDLPLKNSLAMRSGTGSVTFSRASTATYIDRYGVLKTAGIDVPRFEKEGYLNEGNSTNLFSYSNQFEQWSTQNSAITQNVTGPDGVANSAYHFYKTTTGSEENIYISYFSLTAGTTYTASIFAQKAEDSIIRIMYPSFFFSDGTSRDLSYNFDTGVLTDQNNNLQDKNVQILANGWVRLSMTFTVTTSDRKYVNVIYSYSSTDKTGNGVNIYGAQLEALPFTTSYISTTSSTVTRAADMLSATLEGNFPSVYDSRTVIADFDIKGKKDGDWSSIIAINSNGDGALIFGYGDGTDFHCHGGKNTNMLAYTYIPFDTVTKRICAISDSKNNQTSIYKNGVLLAKESRLQQYNDLGDTASSIMIGRLWYGHITNLRIYDRALTAYEVSLA